MIGSRQKELLKTIVEEFPKYGKSKYFDCVIVHTDNEPLAQSLQDMLFEKYGALILNVVIHYSIINHRF